jgi:hypothetical protein
MNKLFAWLRRRSAAHTKPQIKTMTNPISHERVEWLQSRLKVVEASIKLAQATMYTLSGGGVRDDMQRALMKLTAEQVEIRMELRVLSDMGVTP